MKSAYYKPVNFICRVDKNILNGECGNLPFGRTNSVILDQQFSHICDNIYG